MLRGNGQLPVLTREEENLKNQLRGHVTRNEWDPAREILQMFPNMVRIPLTTNGDRVLHFALRSGQTDFAGNLLNSEHVTQQDLAIRNAQKNTAFCLAAIMGDINNIQAMIQRNGYLPMMHGEDDTLPVHFAVVNGHKQIVETLSSTNILEQMKFEDVQGLFFMTINSGMCDVAQRIVQEYSNSQALIEARDKKLLTALHFLARKPAGYDSVDLARTLWTRVRELTYNARMRLISEPSIVLFDAIKSGNYNFVVTLLTMDSELLARKEAKTGLNLLHVAVLFRERLIIEHIVRMHNANIVLRDVDKSRDNVLHKAASLREELLPNLRPDFQMKKELEWFQDMEHMFLPELRTMRNEAGKTPQDVFHDQHRKLSDEVKDTAKGIVNTGMVVAALIVAVAFAAALTTPSGNNNNWLFMVFIIANAIAFYTSCLSIVAFLSIFASLRSTKINFIISLYRSLIFGKNLLLASVIAMVMAFAAASLLIFDRINKWVGYVVALLGLLTIILISLLYLDLFDRQKGRRE